MLSYAEIGAAAMLSRAVAGSIGSTAVFSLPGSEHAVRLAMTRLILPEVGHVVRELTATTGADDDDRPANPRDHSARRGARAALRRRGPDRAEGT